VLDGDLTVRSPWNPDPSLKPAAMTDAVRRALGPQGRLAIIKVPNGYQKISTFHKINGLFPLVRLEDPAYKSRLVDVAALKMIAEPFRPPVADVRSLTGTFEFTSDSVWWKGARASLPATRISGDGRYYISSGDLQLRLHGDPVNPADIRWAMIGLPEHGSGKLDFGMDWTGEKSTYLARNMDLTLERSHVTGQIEATVTDTLAYRNADLHFTTLDTRLLTQLFPAMKFPRPLMLTGQAKFDGGEHSLKINGDVTVDDRLSGRSRLIGNGLMGLALGIFNARDLHVRMAPLQMGLAKAIAPSIKIGGTLTGTMTLNGTTAGIMTAQGDVTHVELGALTRATGRASMRPHGVPWYDVDARMHPLALATLGRFMPSVGLRGSASGPLKLKGPINDLAINTQLTFPDGGFLDLRGTMDIASKTTGYNLDFVTRLFNANAAVAKAPTTLLNSVGSARGRGFDPATMQAQITANVSTSTIDTVSIDRANVNVAAANGMARVDTLAVALPQGIVEAKGTFGLAPGHSGTLSYHVAIGDFIQSNSARESGFDQGRARYRGRARGHGKKAPDVCRRHAEDRAQE
jgi:hypothetical protein